MPEKRKLEMSISLNALEHLGMNLYSNVPSVLSEIVANAWDADATKVAIDLDKSAGKITIDDNGMGMNRNQVIDHFLNVGFKRRVELGPATRKGRSPMGRKGIGKLSTFSIARIVDVYTLGDSEERTAFRMDRDAIRQQIESGTHETYAPEELTDWPDDHPGGTRIVLSALSKNLTGMTDAGLRRRVSRRFSIIGPKNDFRVYVTGKEITPEDRGYQKVLEYVWTYGDQSAFLAGATKLEKPAFDRTASVAPAPGDIDLSLQGWIGTVASPKQLKDEEGDNLNRIAVFMRGKLAQEDVLDDFGQKEIYADYLIGELHCDALDTDDTQDIATSSRQTLKEDDDRFQKLRKFALAELRHIASQWSDLRRESGTKLARSVPAVSQWLHVFDHLWLIDPSWERAKGTQHLEAKIGTFLKQDTEKLSKKERDARIDIAYRTASGSHVIIELKRASVATPVDRLVAQVRKYRAGVRKILDQSDDKNWPIEIIVLVGKRPPEWNDTRGQEDVAAALKAVDARLVFYDQLVGNAQKSYADYLEAHKKVDRLWDVFKSIDDFAPQNPQEEGA